MFAFSSRTLQMRAFKRSVFRWTSSIILDTRSLAKLAALVPAPRVHLTRFHGVLAPGAKWRSWIVPKPSVELDVSSAAVPIPLPESAPGINDPAEANGSTKEMLPRRNYAWAYLMMRV